jgi:hypothetical protein
LIFFYEEIYTYLGWKMLHMQLAWIYDNSLSLMWWY